MLTAEKAREIAGVDKVSEGVALILSLIEKEAKQKKRNLRTWECGFGEGHLYGGHPNETQKAILEKLKELGFSVKISSECGQFVNVFLEVTW